jgi:CheY-like chemotaxis protein
MTTQDTKTVGKVLVVDDEPDLCELLHDALAASDLEIQTAANGADAIRIGADFKPDLIVTDLRLGDCTGLDVLDRLRDLVGEVPAIVMTGYGDPQAFAEASQRRPVELLTKPIDVGHLQQIIRQELSRQVGTRRLAYRTNRLRKLAHQANIQRKNATRQFDDTCTDLAAAYRSLSEQSVQHKAALDYQREVIATRNDDDVFRSLFRLFVRTTGPVFGVAMVCDGSATLQIAGRFGVPNPDNPRFCQALASPFIDTMIANPTCTLTDAGEEQQRFDESIRRFLPGLSVLAIPLVPAEGELIGLVVLYRKGEQPFTDADVALAELVAPSTAAAIRRND